MNWLNEETMRMALEIATGRSYDEAARILSAEHKEYISAEQLRSAIRRYKQRGQVEMARAIPVSAPTRRAPHGSYDRLPIVQEITFGAVGDSHICSNYERNDILSSLYDIFQERGVESVYHTGNWIDGEAPFNQHEINVRGIDGQCNYFLDVYPQRHGIITYYVTGDDHENWWSQRQGINIGQHLEDMAHRRGRDDLRYLGFMEADVDIMGVRVRVLHAGGGSSYALSHTSQKIVDSYEDYDRPDILLIGHYHKAHYLPYYRGVCVIQTGTTQEPTPFMKKKRLHADLGGWIITIGLNEAGKLGKIQAEFIHYPSRTWRSK